MGEHDRTCGFARPQTTRKHAPPDWVCGVSVVDCRRLRQRWPAAGIARRMGTAGLHRHLLATGDLFHLRLVAAAQGAPAVRNASLPSVSNRGWPIQARGPQQACSWLAGVEAFRWLEWGSSFVSFFIVAVAILFPTPASGWGEAGHVAINRTACEKVPAGIPQFLHTAAARIAWLGPE